jgi:hypothetical protein
MTILHLDSGRTMRGGQWQALHLVRGLAKRGHQSTLLAAAGSGLLAEARALDLDARALPVGAVCRLARRADLVHAHDAKSHTLAAVVGGAPLVVSRRVAFPVGRGIGSRWKYARARHFLAISRFVKLQLLEAGVAEDKISIVSDGAEIAALAQGGGRIVGPASDDPRKGTALALEAARIAGVELDLSRSLREDLAHAAAFVYLSYSEGLGSAILLAMSMGVPVVASRAGGIPEIVRDGVTGLLVDNDAQAVAAAIRRLLDDRDLACAMALRARQMVEEEFSLDRMIDETVRVYQRVLA